MQVCIYISYIYLRKKLNVMVFLLVLITHTYTCIYALIYIHRNKCMAEMSDKMKIKYFTK